MLFRSENTAGTADCSIGLPSCIVRLVTSLASYPLIWSDSIVGAPLICAELKNPCENTKTILPPTTAIATKRSVAITGATALLEVSLFCFDCSFVILILIKIEKMLK